MPHSWSILASANNSREPGRLVGGGPKLHGGSRVGPCPPWLNLGSLRQPPGQSVRPESANLFYPVLGRTEVAGACALCLRFTVASQGNWAMLSMIWWAVCANPMDHAYIAARAWWAGDDRVRVVPA